MEDSLSLGFSQRHKRSLAHMEDQEGSISPTWTSNRHNTPHASNLRLHSFWPSFQDPNSRARRLCTRPDQPNPRSYTPTEPTPTASTSVLRPHASGLHLPRLETMASAAPRRFIGDGFDYRRPVSSAQEQDMTPVDLSGEEDGHIDLSQNDHVIDLTTDDSGYGVSQEDNAGESQGSNVSRRTQLSSRSSRNHEPSRLPRGMDIIIDLDNGREEWSMAADEPGSPEIEFISSRTINPPRRGPPTLAPSNSDGDEVEFVRANALPIAEVQRRQDEEMDRVLDLMGDMNGRFTHLRAQVERFNAQVNRTAANFRRTPVVPPRGPRSRTIIQAGFAGPGFMDFELVGFDMGMEPTRPQAPPPPTYQAPPKAPEGFTRSPQEDDTLLCPNCEQELCLGEDEVKRQVWIVKTCGHVYCGECAANRSIKRSSKGKEKPAKTKPFKECVVEGCGKKVQNAKAMFQIFL
ncbi:hypothetical protein GQ44DRAFT_658421 [Phaeosphaeriaceae sp. PMI808]|nr:hypothetical protein GQ44DRAFT_658421 [Phaeosphaeriaceae sp. PMI808]